LWGDAVKQQLESLVCEMIEKGILFPDARREFEKRFIARVLQRHRGNLSRAARDLRIHRNTLGKKIEEYQLDPVTRPSTAGGHDRPGH
jgi:Fis family transcriptional regulator, factor for inversion stimulation protein